MDKNGFFGVAPYFSFDNNAGTVDDDGFVDFDDHHRRVYTRLMNKTPKALAQFLDMVDQYALADAEEYQTMAENHWYAKMCAILRSHRCALREDAYNVLELLLMGARIRYRYHVFARVFETIFENDDQLRNGDAVEE